MNNLERSRSIIRDAIGRKMDIRQPTSYISVKSETEAAKVVEHIGNQRCRLGGTATLRCTLGRRGGPSPCWLKNSYPLGEDERISQTFDGRCARLEIVRVQPSDFGCYECVVMTTDVEHLSTGTLLLEDSSIKYAREAEKDKKTETHQEDGILRRQAISDDRREEIKRSVLQRLEAAKNRYSYQPKPVACPANDLIRKKSLYEPIRHSQNEPKIEPSLQRSATTIRQKLLEWCKIQLRDYKGVEITNFSSSWNDGLAFCALIHRFCPDAFDFDKLDPNDIRKNFQLAFDTATNYGNVTQLLDVEDMVRMKHPDWKCIFMYVESIYRAFAVKKPVAEHQ